MRGKFPVAIFRVIRTQFRKVLVSGMDAHGHWASIDQSIDITSPRIHLPVNRGRIMNAVLVSIVSLFRSDKVYHTFVFNTIDHSHEKNIIDICLGENLIFIIDDGKAATPTRCRRTWALYAH